MARSCVRRGGCRVAAYLAVVSWTSVLVGQGCRRVLPDAAALYDVSVPSGRAYANRHGETVELSVCTEAVGRSGS